MTDHTHPRLIMLCGVPTSGKSSYVRQGIDETPYFDHAIVLSTDDYIEREAKNKGLSYNEAFDEFIGPATEHMYNKLEDALRDELDIIWDQTNLTPKTRKRKLAKIHPKYEKTAVWFDISLEEAIYRNSKRGTKFVPRRVLYQMHEQFVPPSKAEGFEHIIKPLQ